MTLSSAQLQRKSEQARERLSESLDGLRQHLSPSILVDDLLGGKGRLWKGDDVLPAVVRQAKNNPVAYALIAAGLGWLIYSETRSTVAPAVVGERRTAAKRRTRARKSRGQAKPARRKPAR